MCIRDRYLTVQDKQAAKQIIKVAKKHPKLYTKEDVRYARMIKKRIKKQRNEQRHSENKSE